MSPQTSPFIFQFRTYLEPGFHCYPKYCQLGGLLPNIERTGRICNKNSHFFPPKKISGFHLFFWEEDFSKMSLQTAVSIQKSNTFGPVESHKNHLTWRAQQNGSGSPMTLGGHCARNLRSDPKFAGAIPRMFKKSKKMYTLPESNSSHLKMDGWKMTFPFGMAYHQVLC